MPPRRTSRQTSANEVEKDQKKSCGSSETDKNQWICFIKDSILEVDPNIDNKPVFCKLRHPKTEEAAMFMFANEDRDIFEVTVFKENYRSWFIGNCVQQDGSIYMTIPVDPVFLALPYLKKQEQTGKYMPLDQVICDDDFPECNRLPSTSGIAELHNVADIKGSDDLQAYRYNEEKTLTWLKLKTERLAECLSDRNFCVSGSQSSMYIRTKRAMTATYDDYMRYAFGMVSDYLALELSAKLKDHIGIPDVVEKKENEPPLKKVKTEDLTPTEDYSKEKSDLKPQKNTKMTAGQKKLSKVDTSGMKSLASFFSPKAKT